MLLYKYCIKLHSVSVEIYETIGVYYAAFADQGNTFKTIFCVAHPLTQTPVPPISVCMFSLLFFLHFQWC